MKKGLKGLDKMKISGWSVFIGVVVILAVGAAGVVVFRAATAREKETSLGKSFIYDLDDLGKTDPALIKYEESGRIETQFQNSSAIALDSSDRIYVAGDKSIRVFDSGGVALWEVKVTDAPGCLAVADDGTVYVGLRDHIEVYDANGVRRSSWESPGQNTVLTSVAVYGDDVFAADAGGRVVLRYDRSGDLIERIGEKDEERNIPGFVIPSPHFDLAVAPDGLLRVTNPGLQRIEAYTFDGYLELSWGKASNRIDGFAGCSNPVNFAILPDGGFVTCEKGLPRVKVYTADGTFEGVVAGTEVFDQGDGPSVLDVAVDSRGRILVLDPDQRAVRVFTSLEGLES